MSNVIETIFRGVDEVTESTKKIEQSIGAVGATVAGIGRAFAGFFAAASVVQFAKMFITASDAMQEMQETLAQVRSSSDDVARTQNSLVDLAIRTDTSLKSTFELYTRLAHQAERLKLSEQDRLTVVESINMAQQLAGPLAGDVAAQFQRALLMGELSGRSMIAIFSNAPRLMRAVSDELGVAPEKLKELAEQGKLTVEVLTRALINQSGAIREDFELTGQTVGESLTNLGTAFGVLIKKIDDSIGATDFIADRLQGLAEIIADMAEETTASDVANEALVAKGKEIEALLAEERRLIEEMSKPITRTVIRNFKAVQEELPEDSQEVIDIRARTFVELRNTREELKRTRGEFDQLQATFNDTSAAEKASDGITALGASTDAASQKAQGLVDSLREQAEMLGKTARAATLYKLQQDGASKAQIDAAMADFDKIEQFARVQERLAATASEGATFVPEGEEGPVREIEMGLDELANVSAATAAAMGRDMETAATVASVAWDEATRNIQNILADSLFNSFEDGLKGMLKSFIDMLRQMVAQALSANIVDAMFGTSSNKTGAGNWLQTAFGALFGGAGGGTKKPAGKATGGWTEPGAVHPINENEPEVLLTGNRSVVPLSPGVVSIMGAGRATGGWTEPGRVHPINENEPEFLITQDRARVVPLSKAAANGIREEEPEFILGPGRASGGWTTPGTMHPVNESEPEFLMSANRSRVVPLSKAAANGIQADRGGVFAPNTTVNVQSTLSGPELELMLRRRDEALLAKWKVAQRDGSM